MGEICGTKGYIGCYFTTLKKKTKNGLLGHEEFRLDGDLLDYLKKIKHGKWKEIVLCQIKKKDQGQNQPREGNMQPEQSDEVIEAEPIVNDLLIESGKFNSELITEQMTTTCTITPEVVQSNVIHELNRDTEFSLAPSFTYSENGTSDCVMPIPAASPCRE